LPAGDDATGAVPPHRIPGLRLDLVAVEFHMVKGKWRTDRATIIPSFACVTAPSCRLSQQTRGLYLDQFTNNCREAAHTVKSRAMFLAIVSIDTVHETALT
jgi:hypothetical protein